MRRTTIYPYPRKIRIDGKRFTLEDANRLLLALSRDEELAEMDSGDLRDNYKKERQRYLDGLYEMTDERKATLLRLERRMAAEIRNCDLRLERMRAREKEKRDKGMRFARHIRYHWETGDYSYKDFATTDELELMESLFHEDKLNDYWGVCGEVFIGDTDTGEPSYDKKEKPEETLPTLNMLREKYVIAWQDIEKIVNFRLFIEMEY